MIIKNLNLQPLFSPAGIESGATTDIFEHLTKSLDDKEAAAKSSKIDDKDDKIETDDDKDEIDLKFLDNEEAEDEPDDTDDDDKEEDKIDEEDELKLEDDKEDELELAKIPKMKDIEEAYPGILKKFPALRNSFFRERAFSEVFPTVQDAKDAKESIEQFNNFQSELLSGNIEGVLKTVKTTDEKAFNKIAANILDSLVRVDPNAHLGVTRQVTKGVLNYLYTAATNTLKKNPGDKQAEQLQIAAELVHDALYNTKEVTPDQRKTEEQEDPERVKFKAEREEFEKTKYTTAFNSVSSKVNNIITSSVTKNIDLKNTLPTYVKSNLVKDIMSECDRQLMSDKPFRNLIDKMWISARNNGYSDDSLNKIQTALKQKAATILPGIMRAKKGEALKGLYSVKRKTGNDRELSRTTTGDKTPREKTTLSRRSDSDKPRDNESALDYLNRKLG